MGILLGLDLLLLVRAGGGRGRDGGPCRYLLDGVHRTAFEYEVSEFRHKGLELVLDWVLTAIRGPARGIPDGGVEGHGLGWVVTAHGFTSGYLSYGDVVYVESALHGHVYDLVRFLAYAEKKTM